MVRRRHPAQKTVKQWSKAVSRDKLATAADFVTQMWKAGVLKDFIADSIKTMDDVKPLAQRLSDEIDLYFSQGKLDGGTNVATAAATVMQRRWR